ncbi:MAG: DNA gyrase subunit A [Bacilli bacterium]|nr:DNA gyrase subunit A [Bacilli bacterium]
MEEKLTDVNITKEMEKSFLDYAMSVIVSRAIPDVRDGLKPVHRRILYAMNGLGLTPDKQYKKSVRVVGEVLGKYHPHGDVAVYETMVRMAQDFSYRYLLVDGHGNFGSIDGDSAAAMRYTEAKMSKISTELLRDINKETVNFVDNFDGTEKEPEVLPSRFPNLLVNGATGIAVGMATNIPPHNLTEVLDGIIYLINNKEATVGELMEIIKGPDFPTGASILGIDGIRRAYTNGKGIITIRAKAEIEESKTGKQSIVVTEIPYQTNKARLIEKIADLVRDKQLDGISDLRDESSRNGIRIVIELKREANSNVVLNNLYKHTSLQSSFGINFLALVDGQPRTLNLKEMLSYYLDHQKEIILRRTKFDLDKAERRVHILEGLKIALNNIDEIVKIIKQSKSEEDAVRDLINAFNLTEIQSKAILEMKLRRLTGLERDKIEEELKELHRLIVELRKILDSEEEVLRVIEEEIIEIKEKYGDARRTEIDLTSVDYIEDESLIPVEEIIVTVTNKGYIKRLSADTYRTQNRGGVGVKGITTNEEDFAEHLLYSLTHSNLMFFTNKGKVYRLKGYEIPEFSRQAKGLPIVNILPLEQGEFVNSVIKIDEDDNYKCLFFTTKFGIVKRTSTKEFESIRSSGKIAISLRNDDELISVKKTNGDNEIIIGSTNGRMVRFSENEVRVMGRTAGGVTGMRLTDGNTCVGAEVALEAKEVLIVTKNGYGKKTPIHEYRLTRRGSKGVKTVNITDKNGELVAFKSVDDNEDLIIITDSGVVIRMPVKQISSMGRSTQGVKLMSLKEGQIVTTVAKIDSEIEEEV